MGAAEFDNMSREIINKSEEVMKKSQSQKKPKSKEIEPPDQNKTGSQSEEEIPRQGKLKIDATVSDQMIT